ncbi:hypothetical protein JBE27_00225 [Streptomyces albiflaviniger]|nr:hypothetical protein [Streptomyces albiflaviniger]
MNATTTADQSNEQPRSVEVVIPGALAEFLDGTNLATGADDADPASRETRLALETARSGRGRTRVITASTLVLDVITEYAETLLDVDEKTRAERRAARTWLERVPEARRQVLTAEQAEAEQEIAETELAETVETVEQAEANDGTWRGKWIGAESAQQLTLDGPRPDRQEGALFS